MLLKGTEIGAAAQRLEFSELLVGPGSAAKINQVQPGQRPDAIDSIGIPQLLEIRGLEVGVGFHGLIDVIHVPGRISLIDHDLSIGIHESQLAIVMFKLRKFSVCRRGDEAHEEAGKIPKSVHLVLEMVDHTLEPRKGPFADGLCIGDFIEDDFTILGGQRGADSSGNHPGGVNPLSSKQFDDFLSEFPEHHAIDCQCGKFFHHTKDMP